MSTCDLTTPIAYGQIDDVEGYRFGDDGTAQSCWERFGGRTQTTDRWHDLSLNLIRGRKYLMICIKRGGKRFKTALHPLVCEAFHGACPPGMECRHKDDDPLNNRADNLVWGTRKQNIADRSLNGIQPLGEQCYQARLTAANVREMRRRYSDGGVTCEQLGVEYGVSMQHAHGIVNRLRWKHVV